MEGGTLTEEETNRLGEALMDLDAAIEEMKIEQGITESVKSVRGRDWTALWMTCWIR